MLFVDDIHHRYEMVGPEENRVFQRPSVATHLFSPLMLTIWERARIDPEIYQNYSGPEYLKPEPIARERTGKSTLMASSIPAATMGTCYNLLQ